MEEFSDHLLAWKQACAQQITTHLAVAFYFNQINLSKWGNSASAPLCGWFIYLIFDICLATEDAPTEEENRMSIFPTTSRGTCEKVECPPLNIPQKSGSAECSNGEQVGSTCV